MPESHSARGCGQTAGGHPGTEDPAGEEETWRGRGEETLTWLCSNLGGRLGKGMGGGWGARLQLPASKPPLEHLKRDRGPLLPGSGLERCVQRGMTGTHGQAGGWAADLEGPYDSWFFPEPGRNPRL